MKLDIRNVEGGRTQTPDRTDWRYRLAIRIALVTGILSALLCLLLFWIVFQTRASDLANSEKLESLRLELIHNPGNDALREEIRTLDWQLRASYFRRRTLSRRAITLLIGSMILFLVALKWARGYRQSLPMPQPQEEPAWDQQSTLARRSVMMVGLIALVAIWTLAIFTNRVTLGEFGSALQSPGSRATAAFPSEEDLQRNWSRFRGPGGLGIAAGSGYATYWDGSTGEGVLWKTPIPLPGESSPVVWENRVFVTGATEERREVYCLDADSGKILWSKAVENVPGSPQEAPEVAEDTGFAAPTPATDGRRVVVTFANGDIACFDLEGKRLWARNLGLLDSTYGYASSPILYRDRVIVQYDQASAEDELSQILALDAASGRTLWTTTRPVPSSWSSPIVAHTDVGEQIITTADPWVIAYDPTTGDELWRVDCLGGDVVASPIYAGGLVFAGNAYYSLAAIRPDGQGDVTETHVAWTLDQDIPDICTPLSDGKWIFLLDSYGVLSCYDVQEGTRLWQQELDAGFWASPCLVEGRVYILSQNGEMFILAASGEYQEIGQAALGESTNACPAFVDGRIYIRGKKQLYCIEGSGTPLTQ